MSESLVSRVKRLVSGGVNSMIDAVENASPETVMQEAIREVDQAVDQVRGELGKVAVNKHLATRRLMISNAKHEELAQQIQVAVDQKRDDLAEAAIARQLDLEAQLPVLEAAIKDAAAEEDELEGYINALHARQREMREELEAFRSSRAAADDGGADMPGSSMNAAEQKTSKAERAFERVMQSGAGLPGVSAGGAAKLAELDKLARDNRIQERLAALKVGRKDDAS